MNSHQNRSYVVKANEPWATFDSFPDPAQIQHRRGSEIFEFSRYSCCLNLWNDVGTRASAGRRPAGLGDLNTGLEALGWPCKFRRAFRDRNSCLTTLRLPQRIDGPAHACLRGHRPRLGLFRPDEVGSQSYQLAHLTQSTVPSNVRSE